MNSLFAELRRRNVFRVAAAYAVVGWLITQAVALVEEPLALPGWTDTLVIVLLLAGMPITLILAWAFEMTPEGIKPTQAVSAEDSVTASTGKQLGLVIIGALGLVIVLIIGGRFLPSAGPSSTTIAATSQQSVLDKSIAVLPFADFSVDGDYEWFSDGITEEILNSLARTPDLRVASRTSSFAFKGSDQEITSIAETLGVAHILEGSVRRTEDRLRVTAQLIRASDGFHLWSRNFDNNNTDAIAIQEEIAIEIARTLETALDPDALAEMADVGTDSIPAYEAYLEGLALNRRAQQTGAISSTQDQPYEAYERAREIDPTFARAHFQAADRWSSRLTPTVIGGGDDELSPEDNLRNYLERVDQAIVNQTDAGLAAGYRARRAYYLGQFNNAIEFQTEFLEAHPQDMEAINLLIHLNVFMGHYDEARRLAQDYLTLARLAPDSYLGAVINLVWAKDYEGALSAAREAIQRDPDNAGAMYQAHRALLWAGAFDEAAALVPDLLANPNWGAHERFVIELRHLCAIGDREAAEALYPEIVADATLTKDVSAAWHAAILLGYRDEAVEMVRAYDRDRAPFTSMFWLFYPQFDWRAHPNLAALLEREGATRPDPVDPPFACPPA